MNAALLFLLSSKQGSSSGVFQSVNVLTSPPMHACRNNVIQLTPDYDKIKYGRAERTGSLHFGHVLS